MGVAEELRTLAGAWDEWGLGGKLTELAERLERQGGVPDDDAEAARWVREHGGIELLEMHEEAFGDLQRERDDALRLSAEYKRVLNGACLRLGLTDGGGLPAQDSAIFTELDRRLMPPGMEWPRFDDGEKVCIADKFASQEDGETLFLRAIFVDNAGVDLISDECSEHLGFGERVKRPAVLAADGKPLEVWQTVWDVESGIEYEVVCIHTDEDTPVRVMRTDGSHLAKAARPSTLTHQRPVLGADGKPLRERETACGTKGGSYRLTSVHDGKVFARHVGGSFGAEVESAGGEGLYRLRADQLTHAERERGE